MLNSHLEDGQPCRTEAVVLPADKDALEAACPCWIPQARAGYPPLNSLNPYEKLSFAATTLDPKTKYWNQYFNTSIPETNTHIEDSAATTEVAQQCKENVYFSLSVLEHFKSIN